MAARCGDSSVVSKPVEGDLGDICAQAWERGVVDGDGRSPSSRHSMRLRSERNRSMMRDATAYRRAMELS